MLAAGIQPTGDLHLGNLLGAILRWVRMQDEAQCLFFLADLHALTVDVDPGELGSNLREMAAALIASGIDPARSTIFAQSAVPAHAELAWLLGCTARMGWLNRMTQFKDKAGKNSEHVSLGLFAYPSLMAADILLYKATHVPVGDDQKQHLELTRDIAAKFNNDYAASIAAQGVATEEGQFFPITEPSLLAILPVRDRLDVRLVGPGRDDGELGIEAKVLESSAETDYDPNINSFISEGCDLIVTVGVQELLQAVAPNQATGSGNKCGSGSLHNVKAGLWSRPYAMYRFMGLNVVL